MDIPSPPNLHGIHGRHENTYALFSERSNVSSFIKPGRVQENGVNMIFNPRLQSPGYNREGVLYRLKAGLDGRNLMSACAAAWRLMKDRNLWIRGKSVVEKKALPLMILLYCALSAAARPCEAATVNVVGPHSIIAEKLTLPQGLCVAGSAGGAGRNMVIIYLKHKNMWYYGKRDLGNLTLFNLYDICPGAHEFTPGQFEALTSTPLTMYAYPGFNGCAFASAPADCNMVVRTDFTYDGKVIGGITKIEDASAPQQHRGALLAPCMLSGKSNLAGSAGCSRQPNCE